MEYDRSANGSDLFGAVQVPLTYDSVFAAPTGKVTEGDFEYRTVWRLGKPLLEVKGIGEAVVQAGGTLIEGRGRMPLVDVGDGPFPDAVRGKAALARLTEGTEPAVLAQAAQDAGVQALFVTDDAAGRLMAWWGTADNADRPLQIATVGAADARRLRDAGRVDMTGTRNTPYTYDLSEGHRGGVPDRDLTYEPGRRDLATLRTRYHAAEPASGGEFRYSITDTFPIGIGFRERIDYPVERTEYVSTGPGQLWHESVTAADGALEQRSGTVRYEGGARTELNWFKPVWHPYLGTGLGWGQQRAGNRLQFNAPGWRDSAPTTPVSVTCGARAAGCRRTRRCTWTANWSTRGRVPPRTWTTRRPTSTRTGSSPTPRSTPAAGASGPRGTRSGPSARPPPRTTAGPTSP